MRKFINKSLLVFLSLIIFAFPLMHLTAQPVKAQWYKQTYPEFVNTVQSGTESELFGERYTAAQVKWVIYGLIYSIDHPFITCIVMAGIQGNAAECIVILARELTGIGQIETTSPVATLNIHSVSSLSYFANIANRWHLTPEASAQGFGFDNGGALIFNLWQATRNVSYSFLILIIIIMSFMIMFRVKISPQTVITVQSALPKVFTTLILITFSYAIAGFMIDLMYVVIGLLAAILQSANVVASGTTQSWSELFGQLTYAQSAFMVMFKYWLFFTGALFWTLVSNPAGIVMAITSQGSAIGLLVAIVSIIMSIVILILAFRVTWMLLKTFVLIMFAIIFGPIQILLGAIGGSGFSGWIKNLASLLAVYPTVGFMYVLAFVFLRAAYTNMFTRIVDIATLGQLDNLWPFDVLDPGLEGRAWTPPFLNGGGTGDTDLIWLGASVAIIALAPKAADIVKGMVAGRPYDMGRGIGEGLAFASGALSAGVAASREGAKTGAYSFVSKKAGKAGTPGGTSARWLDVQHWMQLKKWGI
ncbi:hypothetical protein IPM62_00405 [Candidatus Woesebacteria bacterium]|nr:MAG: hypothetical protein IPM62_00405 [Candidatus Woesebacteria bacterium]